MNKGVLIFAHNSRDVDYILLSMVSAKLAKKNLKVPVSLVTDQSTVDWMHKSGIHSKVEEIFENIILVDRPQTTNRRVLHDGTDCSTIPFVNTNRDSVYDLTPYDKTLLIDSDFLIFSDRLNHFWEVDQPILIPDYATDVAIYDRFGYHDKYISDTGIKMCWATTVMFDKSEFSKTFFDLVSHVRENYERYSMIYRFDSRQYRNDIAFSIARHLMFGFDTSYAHTLPPPYTTLDRDVLVDVKNNGDLKFLITQHFDDKYCLASISGVDVHVMNKQSIVRHADKLMEL